MSIRTAVLYKKNFALLLEESVSHRFYADRAGVVLIWIFCSHVGHRVIRGERADVPHRCGTSSEGASADVVFCVWVLGQVPVYEVWDAVLRQELRGGTRRNTVRT